MSSLWIELVLVLLLVMLNALLAGSEMAFVTLREGQIERLGREGPKGRAAAELARDPNRFLATVQVGITFAGFLASATAAVSIAEPLVEPLAFLGEAAEPVAVVLVTLVLSYISLVLGELAPKRIALQRAEGWVTFFGRSLQLMAVNAKPIVWLLSKSTDVVVRLLGGDPAVRREELSKDEIREIVSSRPGFHKIERTIIAGALELAERPLRDITVPRPSIVSVAADADVKEGLRTLQAAGVSRAPVIGETIDEVVGVLHIRDLIGKEGPVSRYARDILALPETLSVMKALAEMQKTRTQLAVVVDEYGGTEGLVTIEDILEEIVGEIYDEFDVEVASVVEGGSETYLPGHFPIHDAKDIGLDLPDSEYSTIAGLIMHRLGRMPEKGDALQFGDLKLEVLRTSGRTVERVRVTKLASRQVTSEED